MMTIWERKSIYQSSLSVDQCVERLTTATDKEPQLLPNVTGFHTVSGMINDHKFRLRKRRIYPDRMSESVLYGTLHEDRSGTRIEAHFGMPPWEKIFWIFWFTMVIYWSLDGYHQSPFLLLLGSGAFLTILIFGRFYNRNERKYLLAFLEKTLNAHRIEGGKGN